MPGKLVPLDANRANALDWRSPRTSSRSLSACNTSRSASSSPVTSPLGSPRVRSFSESGSSQKMHTRYRGGGGGGAGGKENSNGRKKSSCSDRRRWSAPPTSKTSKRGLKFGGTTISSTNNEISSNNNSWVRPWLEDRENVSTGAWVTIATRKSCDTIGGSCNDYKENNPQKEGGTETGEKLCPVKPGTKPYGEGGPGGNLHDRAVEIFERAYGFGGRKAEDHDTLIQKMQVEVACSERAIKELLYGFSYSKLLESLRSQVRLYPRRPTVIGNKNRCKEKRLAELNTLALILEPRLSKSHTH